MLTASDMSTYGGLSMLKRHVDECFLSLQSSLFRNCLYQRKNSLQDGVFGKNCPIPPGGNFTYMIQVKDQTGSYFYFPSLSYHQTVGGFGGIRVLSRPVIPFPLHAGDYTLLVGDWYKANHSDLKGTLDNGRDLQFPYGLLINGYGWNRNTFTVDQGRVLLQTRLEKHTER